MNRMFSQKKLTIQRAGPRKDKPTGEANTSMHSFVCTRVTGEDGEGSAVRSSPEKPHPCVAEIEERAIREGSGRMLPCRNVDSLIARKFPV